MCTKIFNFSIPVKLPHQCLFSHPCPLQAFTVVTKLETCTQTTLCINENLCTVLIPLSKNNFESANLPHKPLCFTKIKTTSTTAFLISITVVPNPYSRSTALDSQTSAP